MTIFTILLTKGPKKEFARNPVHGGPMLWQDQDEANGAAKALAKYWDSAQVLKQEVCSKNNLN